MRSSDVPSSEPTCAISGENDTRPQATIRTRLLWFAAIWLASVAALGAVAYAIRLALKA